MAIAKSTADCIVHWPQRRIATPFPSNRDYGRASREAPVPVSIRRRTVQTFAAGAILTMLANSMIPEAYAYGEKLAGLLLVFGFAVAVSVVVLERSSRG